MTWYNNTYYSNFFLWLFKMKCYEEKSLCFINDIPVYCFCFFLILFSIITCKKLLPLKVSWHHWSAYIVCNILLNSLLLVLLFFKGRDVWYSVGNHCISLSLNFMSSFSAVNSFHESFNSLSSLYLPCPSLVFSFSSSVLGSYPPYSFPSSSSSFVPVFYSLHNLFSLFPIIPHKLSCHY